MAIDENKLIVDPITIEPQLVGEDVSIEPQGLMDHGGETWDSRDFHLPTIKCSVKECPCHNNGYCEMPSAIKIGNDGMCEMANKSRKK